MKITRRFTKAGQNVYDQFEYTLRSSMLRNPDGSVVFEMHDIEVPKSWSQVATDILAQKYFRKAGVPQLDREGNPVLDGDGNPVLGAERSARQVVHRLAGCWTYWGKAHGYLTGDEDSEAFYDEIAYMLMAQMVAPNSPQWFNTGLNFAYGITGPSQGHFYVDPKTRRLSASTDAYSRAQVHACFIQSVNDDLVNEGGIFDLVTREARIFKYGSGTGSNFSAIRAEGEPLSGGGVSSGLMSFLKVADRAAGAVKSGGTTRRAAKMVILNADHPDIETFTDWKMVEEQKVASLVAGSKVCHLFLNEIMQAATIHGTDYGTPGTPLHDLVQRALNRGVPMNYIVRVLALVEQGESKIDFDIYNTHYEGEAYITVSGQNSNNSVRVTNDFMDAVERDGLWQLTRRTDGKVTKTMPARDLWRRINFAAWSCADPGLQFHTTVNEWHTCPKDGEINGSNPCSEYMFLDDTACFAPETRVSTPNGLRSVEELYAAQERGETAFVTTDLYTEADHRRVTAHRPALVTKIGEREVFRVTLKDGRSIRTTADHRFLTDSGEWKRVDELAIDKDRIEIRRSGNPIAFTSSNEDVDRWRMIGWLTGDGVFSKDTAALVFGPDEADTARFMESEFNRLIREANAFYATADSDRVCEWTEPGDDALRSLFGEEEGDVAVMKATDRYVADPAVAYRTTTVSRSCHLSVQENGVMQISSRSRAVVRYLEEQYGLKQGTAVYKDVPGALHRVADDLKVAYLQGLFSADGCIRKSATEDEVLLSSSAPELLRSIQLLLSDLGIVARITWTHPQGRKNPQGQLHLYNQQARKFLALVGFPCSTAKNARAEEILAAPFMGALKNPRPSRVVSIESDGYTVVYDVTEPVTHSVVAEGMIAHNCNLASVNLAHFYDPEQRIFDTEGYKHVCRLWTVVLEISVLMAQFPSKEIAQRSYDYRTLGLGYANLGTVLMTAGIPYDSDEGRAWAGAITAIMTGESYATSAEMASELGTFPAYKRNAKQMLRVIRNHRRAAYDSQENEYEGLTIKPVGIDQLLCPRPMLAAAQECWDRALDLGEKHGYRNAQTTVIAPTGTISLVMDCDTTGIEPDFAIVKFKKLAGGGYFKIVNQSVPKALRALGYSDAEIIEIERYIKGHGTLNGCPHVNRNSLKAKGFTDEKIKAIEGQLDTVFDVKFAFNKWTLGEDFLLGLGFSADELDDPGLNVLGRLGFSDDQIEEVNRYVCGTMTIEGAPGLKAEHLPVFDCANKCGKYGERYIDYMGHVKMMAAAQPFISGAISKTINMPNHATLDQVAHVYSESWRLMLKAIALYRDGSKLSQPLNSVSDTDLVEEVTLRDLDVNESAMIGGEDDWNENVGAAEIHERIIEKVYHRADRRRLPKRRHGFVREATVGGHKVFLRTGEYEDGTLGEIFIDMYKEGASFKGLMNCFAVLASKALQYGMPLEKMVDTFTFTRFEPSGPVYGHEAIKNATSIIDYVFRAIGYEYLGREDFVHVKAVDETQGGESKGNDFVNGNGKHLSPGQELYRRQVEKQVERAIDTSTTASPVRPMGENQKKVLTAKAQGYTGEQCGNCGSMRVKQNGACHVCEDCGTTSGCS